MESNYPTIVSTIKSRGYWRIVIRPQSELEARLPTPKLQELIAKSQVTFRGWSFPHISTGTPIKIAQSYIEDTVEWDYYLEFWRMFTSGQFAYLGAIRTDWNERSGFAIPGIAKGEKVLLVQDAAVRIVEAIEFSGRLSKMIPGYENLVIEFSLFDLRDRRLHLTAERRMPFMTRHAATEPDFHETMSLTSLSASTQCRDLGAEMAKKLFNLFGWDPSSQLIQELQNEVIRG